MSQEVMSPKPKHLATERSTSKCIYSVNIGSVEYVTMLTRGCKEKDPLENLIFTSDAIF